MITKILAWTTWFVSYFLIRLPLIIAGFILFPIMYYTRDKKTDKLAKFFWLWDNEEDGIYGADFWIKKYNGVRDFKTAYMWSAVRNPVNNMRFIFGINRDTWKKNYKYYGDKEIPHPRIAREKGGTVWHLSYVKVNKFLWLPSFWYIKATGPDTHFRIRLGWKCTLDWIENNNLSNTGKYSGFAFQLMPRRKG